MVERPQERRQGLAGAGRRDDERVATGGDRLPALALGAGGFGEGLIEPAADERQEVGHSTESYASAEAHLTQQQAAQRGARVLELREDREVVVRGHVERLAGQAPGAPHRGHFLTLAVIFGSLELADREQQRSRARRRAVHRAQAARRLRRELQDLVEVREPDRLEVVKPADPAPGLDDIGGQAREGAPAGRHQPAGPRAPPPEAPHTKTPWITPAPSGAVAQ